MYDQIPYIRVFLSSPGDVNDERKIARDVINNLPNRPSFRDKVAFRVVDWDKPGAGAAMRATKTPQEAINEDLPTPSRCNIVIVIFWSRMGTPFTVKGRDYQSGTHWELLDALSSNRTETLIFRRTEEPHIGLRDPQRHDKVEQYERVEAFFNSELFYHPDGSILRGVNRYETPEDFRRDFDIFFEQIVTKLLQGFNSGAAPLPEPIKLDAEESDNIQTVTAQPWEGSPFPGLRSFTAADEPIFFGRGRETDDLIRRLEANRFVAVVGASGSGKSSLVAAGLLPRLKARAIAGSQDWHIVQLKPNEDPFKSIATALMETLPALAEANPRLFANARDQFADDLQAAPDRLQTTISHILKDEPEWVEILLFIDQFEELFTLVSDESRRKFAALLQDVLHSNRVRVIVTLRADFYHRLAALSTLTDLLREGSFPLSAPKRDSLRDMIEQPAERAGLILEPGLVEQMLDDTGDEPGNLALLAYLLDELYQSSGDTGQLTRGRYEMLGGVQGAIGTRAEGVFTHLIRTQKINESDLQTTLERLFVQLVELDNEANAARRRHVFEAENEPELTSILINALIDARLLTADANGLIEVAHEALFWHWPRLAAWIKESQDDLRLRDTAQRAAAEWEANGRSPDYLWSPSRIRAVNEMLQRRGWSLNATVMEFIRSEADRWLEALRHPNTSNQRRMEIGLQLAVLPDPRPGVSVSTENIPEITWSTVVDGNYSFQIARYPITVQQFDAFVRDADGYSNKQWWDNEFSPAPKATTSFANFPMNNVNWYEATAFCRWLSAKTGKPIRLPTVSERKLLAGTFESVANGNTLETELGQMVAVGLFAPDSPELDLYDLRGNIREWGWDRLPIGQFNRTGKLSNELRPLFGASWDRLADATADVLSADPALRSAEWGFRVVIGPEPMVETSHSIPSIESTSVPEPGTQTVYEFREFRQPPAWMRLLPRLRFPSFDASFVILNPQKLETLLKDCRFDIATYISNDIQLMNSDLLRLFRQHDYRAAFSQNQYQLFKLAQVMLIVLLMISGSIVLWSRGASQIDGIAKSIPSIIVLIMAALVVLLIMLSTRADDAYRQYMSLRHRAEYMRREYFRYLIKLPPYHNVAGDQAEKHLALRVADMDRGIDNGVALELKATRQPNYLHFDRERDEIYTQIVEQYLGGDTQIYYKRVTQFLREAISQCNKFAAIALIFVTVSTGAGTLLVSGISDILIYLGSVVAGIALFFTVLPILSRLTHRMIILETSAKNLEISHSHEFSWISNLDDRAYRKRLESYAETTLRVLEQESAQFGQMIKRPTSDEESF